MNAMNEGRASSPCGGRSESPSQPNAATAAERRSSAAQPPSAARAHLTAAEPWQSAAETVTESDQSGGGPCGGSEDEPERPGLRVQVRNVRVQLPRETAERLELLAHQSGLSRAHFMATALVLGVRILAEQLIESSR